MGKIIKRSIEKDKLINVITNRQAILPVTGYKLGVYYDK